MPSGRLEPTALNESIVAPSGPKFTGRLPRSFSPARGPEPPRGLSGRLTGLGYNAHVPCAGVTCAEGSSVEIRLNGEPHRLPARVSVREMIRELRLDEEAVAVERNRELVRRGQWSGTFVEAGDRIEIVHFVGGG